MNANSKLIGIPSRIAFFVCGAATVLIGRLFGVLRGFGSPSQVRWLALSGALAVVGGTNLALAILPNSWAERACKLGDHNLQLASVPIRMLAGFAAFAYLLTVGLYFAPNTWEPAPNVVYALCPACLMTITVDPSLAAVLLMLAPFNSAVYGSIGALLGFLSLFLRATFRR